MKALMKRGCTALVHAPRRYARPEKRFVATEIFGHRFTAENLWRCETCQLHRPTSAASMFALMPCQDPSPTALDDLFADLLDMVTKARRRSEEDPS